MTEILLRPGVVELISDALDDIVEGKARALVGLKAAGRGKLKIDEHKDRLPILLLELEDGSKARFCPVLYEWERLMVCDECGEERWSEDPEDTCNCIVSPERDNPDGAAE